MSNTERRTNTSRPGLAQALLNPLAYLRWLRHQNHIRGTVRAVLQALVGLVDNVTAASHPWHPITHWHLATASGFSESTVGRALKTLEALGLITRTRGRRMRMPYGWEVEPTHYQLHVPLEARAMPKARPEARTATRAPTSPQAPQEAPAVAPQPVPAPVALAARGVHPSPPPEPGPVRQPWSPWRRIQEGVAALLRTDEVTASMANDLLRGALPVFDGDLTDEQRGRAFVATAALRTKGLDLAREAVHLGLCYGPENERELENVGRDWAAKVVIGSTHCQTGGAMLGALRKFMRSRAEFRGAPEQAAKRRQAQAGRWVAQTGTV